MARLIDADALLDIGEEMVEHEDHASLDWDCAIRLVHNAPTIDAVPVVRCKDCKWCGSPSHCPDKDGMMDCEGFCSWGERIE